MKKRFIIFGIFILFGCQKEDFTLNGMAEDHFYLKSGNQHMPVTVAGNLDSKKILIIIHGGPGGTGISYRDNYVITNVEPKVALVYFDQRFAGNTQGNSGNTGIEFFREDIKNLITILRSNYGTDKQYYLFAHSWGGFLAPYFLAHDNNQSLVDGWIQIGGAHNYHLNDSLTREMLMFYGKQELNQQRNISDWEEIVEWCEQNGFEGAENAGTLNGFAHRAEDLIADIESAEIGLGLNQITQFAITSQLTNGLISSLREIDEPTYITPNSDRLHKISLPTLLLWGKYDFVCPPELAIDIQENIGSKNVEKIIYPNSGHSPMVNQPNKFWDDVINWVNLH